MKSQSTIQMVLVLAVLGLGRDGWRSLIVTTITTEISTEYLHNIYIYRIFKMNSSFEFCIWLTMSVAVDAVFPDRFGKRIIPKIYDLTTKRTFCQAGNVGAWGYIIALMFKTNATLQFTVLPCAVFSNDSQRRFIVFKLIFSQMFTGPVICFANVENASERNDSSFPRLLLRRRRTSRTLIAPDLNIFSWAVSECKSYQTLLSRLMQAPALARNKSEVILHIFPGLRTSYTSK